jgi:hypothetical protein
MPRGRPAPPGRCAAPQPHAPRAPQVTKSGTTDLYRRLLSRYPSLQGGVYRELNFLTQCQQDAGELLSYRRAHAHCEGAGAGAGAGDPACHGCSPLGYAALFNTSGVRARLGACPHALPAQALCAGGPLAPDGAGHDAPATAYRPVFTVDASKAYTASAGAAQRAATLLASVSPRTKLVLLLRNPADMGRAIYNTKLAAECGKHECDGLGGGVARVPPYETIVQRELAFLNTSAAQRLLGALANATRPGDARAAELALAGNWTAFATAHHWETHLWGTQLFLLHGVYAPLVLAWAERFVTPGRPMLVVQSEAYFARAPELIDDLFGTFLFGDADGLRGFAEGAEGLGPAARVRYGAKASQSVASRCAVVDALRGASKALERQLTRYAKAGKVQLLRARATGPLWPRPAECGGEALADAGDDAFAAASDYDYLAAAEPDEYANDYDESYEFVPLHPGGDWCGRRPQRPPRALLHLGCHLRLGCGAATGRARAAAGPVRFARHALRRRMCAQVRLRHRDAARARLQALSAQRHSRKPPAGPAVSISRARVSTTARVASRPQCRSVVRCAHASRIPVSLTEPPRLPHFPPPATPSCAGTAAHGGAARRGVGRVVRGAAAGAAVAATAGASGGL